MATENRDIFGGVAIDNLRDEANKKLAADGAGYHFEAGKEAPTAEMDSIPVPESEHVVYPDSVDHSKRPEFANTVRKQVTKGGTFEVTYDEDGYAVKAKKV